MQTTKRLSLLASTVAMAAGLAACGTYDPYPVSQPSPYPYGTTSQQVGVEYGRVTNVSLLRPATGASSGGSTAGTVLGAVGGAVVGNRISGGPAPNYATSDPVYRITVQTDQGHMRTYDVSATGDLRPGDRVRIENGVIYLA